MDYKIWKYVQPSGQTKKKGEKNKGSPPTKRQKGLNNENSLILFSKRFFTGGGKNLG